MTYEERVAELKRLHQEHNAKTVPSNFQPNAEADWHTIFDSNAAILSERWGETESCVAVVLGATAASLRAILLHSGGGIEAVGRIEGIAGEPYFEVTVDSDSIIGESTSVGRDSRVQVSALEIARDLALQVDDTDPVRAMGLWKKVAEACREWAETPDATPLLPNLHLRHDQQGVSVALRHVDYGLG